MRALALLLICGGSVSGCWMTIPLATMGIDIAAKSVGLESAVMENLQLRKPPPPAWESVSPSP